MYTYARMYILTPGNTPGMSTMTAMKPVHVDGQLNGSNTKLHSIGEFQGTS